jgi:2-aminobenzoate-CoA ligase
MPPSAHVDTFAAEHLPPPISSRSFISICPGCSFLSDSTAPPNCWTATSPQGAESVMCLRAPGVRWTYADLQERVNRIANVLVHEMGVVPGNRVLLRAPNNPMLVACWFAVMKAGAIAVTTMPLLRAKELKRLSRSGASPTRCAMPR